MDLYIFRHGMTYFSKNHIEYGNQVESAEILPEGIPAIEKLGKYLKDIPTVINYTSPFKRCIQTSKVVTEITGKKFEVNKNLADYDPRNESLKNHLSNVLKFAKKLKEDNPNSVSICTHGWPITTLIQYFTKGYVRQSELDPFPDPGILVIIKDEKVTYKDFNN